MTNTPYPHLFTSLQVRSLALRNRIVCAPHLTGLAEVGLTTQAQIAYYAEKARGGAALIVFESMPVDPSGAGFARTVHPYDRQAAEGLRRIADAVHQHDAAVLGQLWHCGRQGSSSVTGMPLLAPSAIACPVSGEPPEAMTIEQIDLIVNAFASAALVLRESGFDGVELAAGHGYLVHQFLSPLSNLRTDDYGGTATNRERFLTEIVDAIRATCGREFVLAVRLSADELLPGGFTLEDTLGLVLRLGVRSEVDMLSVSAGTHASVEQMVGDWSIPRGNLVHLARSVRKVAEGIPVVACGRIVDPDHAEAILARGDADLVGMARALIADAAWPEHARSGRPRAIRPCIACNDCENRLFRGRSIACAVNPTVAANLAPSSAVGGSRRVVVVGGGVAGMEAARVAARRGHSVRLYERAAALGGQLRLLEALGSRREFQRIVRFLESELERLDVEVLLDTTVQAAEVVEMQSDVVVIATGSASNPPFESADGTPQVFTAEQLVCGTPPLGDRVVVADAGTTHDRLLAVAESVLESGREVFVVTPCAAIGDGLSFISVAGIMKRLDAAGAHILSSTEVVGAGAGGVELRSVRDGTASRLHGVVTLVMLTHQCSQGALLDQLDGTISHVFAVGDCVAPRGLERAFHDGYVAGLAA